ncbi:MAG TPA: Uma2 family endonuclease [Chloroflexia bacterium]|nr:Uma2 family endonuclease [Chloroflexia bacterium]
MKTKTPATIEDLYKVEGQAELVNGRIVRMPLHVGYVAHVIGNVKISLYNYSDNGGKKGYAFGSTVAYVVDLPHREAFCPDLAFYTPTGKLSGKFPVGAPVFVIEIRDPGSFGPAADRKLAAKIKDYFDAGTQIVWDVDVLRDRVIRSYRATNPDEPTIYKEDDVADAEPAVPGWSMPVDEIFSLRR